ncbi:MAG: alpha-glucan family phosphorylase [Candidatus Sumerlaeia bacterium]|nr:alpha-glucan family phosphorylase [Candidatus Sumerlaeia bacterium]
MRAQHPLTFLGRVRVVPNIPARLKGLADLSKNMWWTWNPLARSLFRRIDLTTWISCNGNPLEFLRRVRQSALDAAAKDKEVLGLYDRVMEMFEEYIRSENTWYSKIEKKGSEFLIAYFSAEFGLHHTLPQYSGGLGVLAGDHVKSATNLGLPFVGVGILYREGYFFQDIDENGVQQAIYHQFDYETLPIKAARSKKGEAVNVSVEIGARTIHLRMWEVSIGRNSLYLLDADVPENSVEDRRLTARLYGGDHELRIQQEIILGIAGVRALRAMGKEPSVYHMNEGHSSFLALERVREYVVEHKLSVPEAIEMVRATTVFTTHTPVPAGNDVFGFDLIDKYFRGFYPQLGMSRADFLELGYDKAPDNRDVFSMTALALRMASMANGVSKIHGHVSRGMWAHLYRDAPPVETPIDSITNGVHTLSWMSFEMQGLMDQYLPKNWRNNVMDRKLWDSLDKIPDEEIWEVRRVLKSELVKFIHRVLYRQHERFGETPEQLREVDKVFQDDALTIGFARRFATYKRATLIFRDRRRLARLLNDSERPVQIVFAGKAHPADMQGQELIRQIQMVSREPEFLNKIIFIENYDINVARRLTAGCDIWLNNPRKPLEASGTSGMKVPLNGGLNVSILDGWWAEAYEMEPLSGWALGDDHDYPNTEMQDAVDAESFYRTLENEVIPTYFDRDDRGIPRAWMRRVRASMKALTPVFSTDRMVSEYVEKFYLPGTERHKAFKAKSFKRAKDLSEWKLAVRGNWPMVRLRTSVLESDSSEVHVREPIRVSAEVELGRLKPEDVTVEIYAEAVHSRNGGSGAEVTRIPMKLVRADDGGRYHVYEGSLERMESGEFDYTVRVLPANKDLLSPVEMGLVRWA